jgi:hypothetical protein
LEAAMHQQMDEVWQKAMDDAARERRTKIQNFRYCRRALWLAALVLASAAPPLHESPFAFTITAVLALICMLLLFSLKHLFGLLAAPLVAAPRVPLRRKAVLDPLRG